MSKEKQHKEARLPELWEALLTFAVMISVMAVGIIVFHADPHMPMFLGTLFAAVMALHLGFKWNEIEKSMFDGIYRALQAIIILAIVGILVGVWLVSGVVPTMIYYGLQILNPSIFLVATLLICSITSLATGTSWGTMRTMGIALMGVALGLGFTPGMTAGAIISGAYFGDKMSPLSDTTNLAPAMAGTDVFTHVKFMAPSTAVTYIICIVFFAFWGVGHGGEADLSKINAIQDGLISLFHINPLLLIPPLIVIVAIAFKIPAIPGIVLGILAAGVLGPIFQGADCTFGDMLSCGMSGFEAKTGMEDLDSLLSSGGLMSMMFSISMTILAMMFGGIMESTKQLDVIIERLLKYIHNDKILIGVTELTCVASNATMPEQYISIILPGRMYAKAYEERGIAPETLSNALEGAGTVSSALIPWNTCGVYILGVLGVGVADYFPYAIFNWLMPLVVFVMALMGITLRYQTKKPEPESA